MIEVETVAHGTRRDLTRLWRRRRGITTGISVLTCGRERKIYDLGVRARNFNAKRVR